MIATPTPASDGARLPTINMLWIGKLSPVEQLCLTSFCRQGHPVHLYTYDELEGVPAGVTLQDAGQILPQSHVFRNQRGKGKGSLAGFSDLFRYKLLLDRGGWWVDADIFCLRPFDFTAPYVFGFEGPVVASGVIRMPAGCELAERCYDEARRVDPATIRWTELVQILQRNVQALDLLPYVLPPPTFSPIHWKEIPQHVTGRQVFTIPAESHGVHLYNEMWRRYRLDKWRRYPATSVLNILRRHAQIAEPAVPPTLLSRLRASLAQFWTPSHRAA